MCVVGVEGGRPLSTDHVLADRVSQEACETGLPSIIRVDSEDGASVAIAIPIYRQNSVDSIVCLIGPDSEQRIGVMEVWQPIGSYDELNMTKGFFGPLERFQNVSSFVRFERGSGLPGQVWRDHSFIIHDNLPSHPGFLRAAGASAESLQLAIGIPVGSDDFLASVVLISSDAAPMARGYEVWDIGGESYTLKAAAYQRQADGVTLEVGMSLFDANSLPGQVVASQRPIITTAPNAIAMGRQSESASYSKAISIPLFNGENLTQVLSLLI